MLDFSTYKHGNECLAIFCRADMPLELETLKEKLGLSRRSLMYLFKHLNEELQGQGAPTGDGLGFPAEIHGGLPGEPGWLARGGAAFFPSPGGPPFCGKQVCGAHHPADGKAG